MKTRKLSTALFISFLFFLGLSSLASPALLFAAGGEKSLWIATSGGIAKVDAESGEKLMVIEDVGKVRALAVDSERKTLWALGKKSLSSFDLNGNLRFSISIPKSDDHSGLELNPRDGSLWVGGKKKVFHFAFDGQLLGTLKVEKKAKALAYDPGRSLLWIASKKGVSAYSESGEKVLTLNLGKKQKVEAMDVSEGSGHVWVVLEKSIHLYSSNGELVANLKIKKAKVIASDSQGAWVSTKKYLVRLDLSGKALFTVWPFEGHEELEEDDEEIEELVSDPSDLSIWVAGERSIAHISLKGHALPSIPFKEKEEIHAMALFLATALPTPTTAVPNVVGSTYAAAESAISTAKLIVGNVTTANDPNVPQGSVISQNPASGTSVPEGSQVDFVVSQGPVMVSVPNVVGMVQANAEASIVGASLSVGPITTVNSSTVPTGNVISQNPVAGTTVSAGSSVDIVVSLGTFGTVMVIVPDFVGMSQTNAAANIQAATLTIGTNTSAYSSAVPAGYVIDQNPAAGTSVSQGSSVNLVISLGPVTVSVPNVVGMVQATAESSITTAKLIVGNVTTASDPNVPQGSVISQSPASGTSVSEGSSVDMVISLGPVAVTVPNVVGMVQATAESSITTAKLIVGNVTQANDPNVPQGSVISQNPASGTSVPEKSKVNLVVSLGAGMVNVPNLVGMVQATAESSITTAKLIVGNVTTASDPNVPQGSVISQSPASGTSVSEGSSVNLVVSLDPVMVNVPNVVGMVQATAESSITTAKLIVGNVTQANDPNVAQGSVISQSPAGGTSVPGGSSVDMVISLGPVMVNVPDVVGSTQTAAQTAITTAKLTVGAVTEANDPNVPQGSVISQSPAAGTSVPEGTPIDLTVVSSGQLSITISSPLNGELINRESVMVTGTLNSPSNEISVKVNGKLAEVTGNSFFANNIPLAIGQNSITATLMNSSGNTAQSVITIQTNTQSQPVKISSNITGGVPTLPVFFLIDTNLSLPVVSYNVDFDGDGTDDYSQANADNISFTYATEGLYYVKATVIDNQNNSYTDTIAINVISRAVMDAKLQAKWNGMKTSLVNGDFTAALSYFSEGSQGKYSEIFGGLSAQMPTLAANMQNIELIYIKGDMAEYRIYRQQDVNGVMEAITYYIYFIKDKDGFWKIKSF